MLLDVAVRSMCLVAFLLRVSVQLGYQKFMLSECAEFFLDVRLVVLRLHQSWQWEESAPLRLCMPQEAPLHISSTLAKFETEVQNRKDEASMSENEPTSLLRLKSFGFFADRIFGDWTEHQVDPYQIHWRSNVDLERSNMDPAYSTGCLLFIFMHSFLVWQSGW